MPATIIILTDKNFDHHFAQAKLLAIDFWAPWCEPCKDFSRIFQEAAVEFPTVQFATVNVDEEKNLAQDFSVKSVPTFAIIRNQVMVFHQAGTQPKKALIDLLKQAVALPDIQF